MRRSASASASSSTSRYGAGAAQTATQTAVLNAPRAADAVAAAVCVHRKSFTTLKSSKSWRPSKRALVRFPRACGRRRARVCVWGCEPTVPRAARPAAASLEPPTVSQSVKEVLDSLLADNIVDTDKVGTSVFYWAFPSKAGQIVRAARPPRHRGGMAWLTRARVVTSLPARGRGARAHRW